MKRIASLSPGLVLLLCTSCFTLGGLIEEESGPPAAPADRQAPLDQYAATLLSTISGYLDQGYVVEARYLVEDLSALDLPGAQAQELAALQARVDAAYSPDAESSWHNSDTLTPAKDFNGKYGYIDPSGAFAIPAAYTLAEPFSEGLALVEEREGEPRYFIDRAGNKVLEIKPSVELYFYDSAKKTVWLNKDSQDGPVTYDGSFEIPLNKIEVKAMGGFHNGLARCELRTYNIDVQGRFTYTMGRKGTIYIDRNGKERIFLPDGMFWYSDDNYQAYDFSEGRALVRRERDGERAFGYIDTTGKLVVEPQFSAAGHFHDGMAAVMYPNTDKWGFIDAEGEVSVKPFLKANTIRSFSDGVLVYTDPVSGNSRIMKKDGSLVVDFPYVDTVDTIDYAKAMESSGDGIVTVAWTEGIPDVRDLNHDTVDSILGLDHTGAELFALCGVDGSRFAANAIGPFRNGRAFVCCGYPAGGVCWGLIDTRGNWVARLTREWEPQGNFYNGLARVTLKEDGSTAYMNRSGAIVYKE